MATLPTNTTDWTQSITAPGEIVTDLQAIDQCVSIICSTQRGSDPVDPQFGVDWLSHQDRPVNRVIPTLVKDITDQIGRYEKRAILKSVSGQFTQINGNSQVIITVTWKYYNETRKVAIPFNYQKIAA
jgi:phage baseplate assembly protein W